MLYLEVCHLDRCLSQRRALAHWTSFRIGCWALRCQWGCPRALLCVHLPPCGFRSSLDSAVSLVTESGLSLGCGEGGETPRSRCWACLGKLMGTSLRAEPLPVLFRTFGGEGEKLKAPPTVELAEAKKSPVSQDRHPTNFILAKVRWTFM